MNNNRGSWGSNIGFLLAAVGSAVGLGNIWAFPYKMGKSGGFAFLLVYIVLACLIGATLITCELAIGRKTQKGPISAYKTLSEKFGWIGYLAVISPFLIMGFYSTLGGYCIDYIVLNVKELFTAKRTSGADSFNSLLQNTSTGVFYTFVFMAVCFAIVKSGVEKGIERFNKIGMPLLFVMLVLIIVRSVTLKNAQVGLKFMFVPGYAVNAGFIQNAPSAITVLSAAGGQMFFSLSLAMGAMITYGSYLDKGENLVRNSAVIVAADTIVALMAGLAVIPAAVANGINNNIDPSKITLGGPKLLFITLQDVFSQMGFVGAVFGTIFYLLVLIAAVSSAISLIEVIATYFTDKANEKGKSVNRSRVTGWVCFFVLLEGLLVTFDGLGTNGLWVPFQKTLGIGNWNASWLDFLDCIAEGLLMPIGALLMAVMVGLEKKSDLMLDEISNGSSIKRGYKIYFKICIKYLVPIVMLFILLGQLNDFFGLGIF